MRKSSLNTHRGMDNMRMIRRPQRPIQKVRTDGEQKENRALPVHGPLRVLRPKVYRRRIPGLDMDLAGRGAAGQPVHTDAAEQGKDRSVTCLFKRRRTGSPFGYHSCVGNDISLKGGEDLRTTEGPEDGRGSSAPSASHIMILPHISSPFCEKGA